MSTSSGGATSSNGGSTGSGAPKTTADIIGPGGATSGNTNGTHGDKWICLLNYPSAGENVTGVWFSRTSSQFEPSSTNEGPPGSSLDTSQNDITPEFGPTRARVS